MRELAEKIIECVKTNIESVGIDNVSCADLEEIGQWVDIAKDLIECEKGIQSIDAMATTK